jgi:hypothetical protein
MPIYIRKSGVRAINPPAARVDLIGATITTLAAEFPVFEFAGLNLYNSFDIQFPVFDLPNLTVSHQDIAADFYPFAFSAEVISGTTSSFAIIFPVQGVNISGIQATALRADFPLQEITFGAGLQSSGIFAIEFPVFGLMGWVIQCPSTSNEYAVWVHHRDADRLSTYTQWPVTSLVQFNGELVATLADGIYELGAAKDVTTDIDAAMLWVPSAMGTYNLKRIDSVYVNQRCSSEFRIVAVCDETERIQVETTIPARQGVGKDRVLVRRRLSGTYWQFGYENINGSDFSVYGLEVETVRLIRKSK